MSIEDAYLAGLFDGEGSVGVYPNGRRTSHTLSVQIRQNASDVVDRLFTECKERFGGNFRPSTTLSGKKCYNWAATGKNALGFLQAVLPFLRFKKEQALVAVNWYTSRPKMTRDAKGRNQPLPFGVYEEGCRVDETLRLMKQGVCKL